MTQPPSQQIFLSFSPTDRQAAAILRAELEKAGMLVFQEKNTVSLSDSWLYNLQDKLKNCSVFIALVGHEGVQQWTSVEMQLALARNLLPHDDSQWLPIYLLSLPDADPQKIPPILSDFQWLSWQIDSAVPKILLTAIQSRTELVATEKQAEICPYLGLNTFQREHAPLFFGRRKETLEIIRFFGTQSQVNPDHIRRDDDQFCRWIQIEGSSVSGKSSLINAGLIPLIEQGALWPRTGFKTWKILGPMIPSENPLQQLAELLECALVKDPDERDFNRSYKQLLPDDTVLNKRLNAVKELDVGFVLIVDQFEELFTLSNKNEQRRFDAQLANALLEKDSRFFLMTSIATGFLEGFEHLLYLSEWYNTRCKRYALPSISQTALREIIERPAQLSGLNVKDIVPVILADAKNETGVLPLVENALHYLWEHRHDNRLSVTLYTQKGGIAGLLETEADELLVRLEQEIPGSKENALKLLLALTRMSPDGRHNRQRLALDEARHIAGQGDVKLGRKIINFLSGKPDASQASQKSKGGLRLLTIVGAGESTGNYQMPLHKQQFIDLLYEPLIRPRGQDEDTGQPVGYWRTLYEYIGSSSQINNYQHSLTQRAKAWNHSRGFWRWWQLAGWSDLRTYHKLAISNPESTEGRFIHWSKIALGVKTALQVLVLAFVGQSFYWTVKHNLPLSYMLMQQRFRLMDAGFLPVPLPEMVAIESDEVSPPMSDPNISFLSDDGEPALQAAKFAAPGTEIGLAKRFYLSKYEITYQQFDYYVWTQNDKVDYPATAKGGRDQHPVANVSWYNANAYLTWLSDKTHKHYRLPTEAEWQYADRAKTTTNFWWGDGIGKNKANCTDCGSAWDGEQSAPVGSFAANSFGLYDTVGNVHEWTCSAWKEQPDGNEYTCAMQSGASRVFLGGSFRNRSIFLLYSSRDWDVPGYTSDNLGFRVARID
ncbi:SUMF1/EgtB/PvdO family nonheme iron enzyme [Crenothrix sp.]|uniref:nSTAND1 domain-containing NTPase n=1 Tax=Crenothrix sp. TaxID=3100433 RepID=UPI00374CA576